MKSELPREKKSKAQLIASLPEKERNKFYSNLTEEEADQLAYDHNFWARPKQLPPRGDWFGWLIRSGRGWGKNYAGSSWIKSRVEQGYKRIALVGQTKADVRDEMVELNDSALLNVYPDANKPKYQPSKRRVVWPNGAVATLFSGDEPDQLRGPEHDTAWVDELAKFKYPQKTWDNLEMGLRMGNKPRVCITTTPRPIAIIKQLMEDEDVVDVVGHTTENLNNLSDSFINRIVKRYEGTRLGRQELEGQILDDNPGALWNRKEDIEQHRVYETPDLVRVIVAVDPPGTKNEKSAEAGIIACGLGDDGHGYVLEDASRRATPNEWASTAISLYYKYEADRIIGEVNNGGDMVENTVRGVDQDVSYKGVRASRGKRIRAEPVASLYEQGKVHHVGTFPELEDQLCQWEAGDTSPDRLDALVWGKTELFLGETTPRGDGRDLESVGSSRAKQAVQW